MPEQSVLFPLSDLDRRHLHQAANDVWNHIGYDVLQAVAEEERRSVNRVSVSRNDVIELVLDAGRLEEELRRHHQLSPELQLWFAQAGYATHVAELRAAFPYDRYGM